CGELVREATRILPIISITDVMQRLVAEEISIRDMRTILEALVEWGQREKDPIVLAEHVRGALSRYITHKFSGGQNIIPAYLIAKEIEDAVRFPASSWISGYRHRLGGCHIGASARGDGRRRTGTLYFSEPGRIGRPILLSWA